MSFPNSLCLDGAWRLLPIDSFRQGFYPLDDDAWIEQELPAHWQQHPLLERYAGKMVYRKCFALETTNDQRPTTNDQRPTTGRPGDQGTRGPGDTEDATRNTQHATRYWL